MHCTTTPDSIIPAATAQIAVASPASTPFAALPRHNSSQHLTPVNACPDEETEKLSVRPQALPKMPLTSTYRPALPQPSRDELRLLTVCVGWTLQILQSPVRSDRKCPLLSSFVPRPMPQGLNIMSTQHNAKKTSLFDSAVRSVRQGSAPKFPYYNEN